MNKNTTRRKSTQCGYTGALEGMLDVAAVTLLVLGLISALIIMVGIEGGAGVIPGLFTAGSAFLSWLLLRALAELIRIQKKAAGLKYGGRITEPREVPLYECSACGAILQSMYHCEKCGRDVVDNEPEAGRDSGPAPESPA